MQYSAQALKHEERQSQCTYVECTHAVTGLYFSRLVLELKVGQHVGVMEESKSTTGWLPAGHQSTHHLYHQAAPAAAHPLANTGNFPCQGVTAGLGRR